VLFGSVANYFRLIFG